MLKAFMELSALHRLFDGAQGVLEKELGTPVCFPRCGRCCHVPDCMVIEGANMVSFLTGEGLLTKATQIAEDWLLTKHKEATIFRGMPVGVVPAEIKNEWLQLMASRCPFLDEKAKCVIYSSRPLMCHALGVSLDVRYCPRPLGRGEMLNRRAVIDNGPLRQAVEAFKKDCQRQPEWTIRGLAPAILYRAAYPDKWRGLVDDNRIASAKIIGTALDFDLMWQHDPNELDDQGIAFSTRQLVANSKN